MMSDNVIKLQNDAVIPEILNRSGRIILSYGMDDAETVEIEGSITLSEACFLHMLLGKYLKEMTE